MFNAQPSNDAPITPVNGERKMGLMSRIFGGGLSTGNQSANDGLSHNIDKNRALANTDSAVPSPTNADFSSIRSVPVIQKPRYFSKQEADALAILAKQKREMAEHAQKAYKSLRSVDASDTEVHTTHRQYQSRIAKNEVRKLQANAQLAKDLHGLRPAYAETHQQVESANVAAVNAIAAIRQTYGS
jgi:hypothetical protein